MVRLVHNDGYPWQMMTEIPPGGMFAFDVGLYQDRGAIFQVP
jgi:hypothetical protein